MRMNKVIITIFILLSIVSSGYAQSKIEGKFEAGYLLFNHINSQKFNSSRLADESYGLNLNAICGLQPSEKAFVGLGLGYLNFDLNNSGFHGITTFSTFEFIPPTYKKTKLYLRSNLGCSQLWSRQSKERGTSLLELNLGLKRQMNHKMKLYLHSGVLFTQRSVFIPIRLGVEF